MQGAYDRIVWTVIALSLSLIALNPWIAPGKTQAQGDIVRVDITRFRGDFIHKGNPIQVEVVR